MAETTPTTAIRDVVVFTPEGRIEGDVAIADGCIEAIGDVGHSADRIVRGDGRWLFPGLVDAHVHFRDPGPTHKEDWTTGSAAAVAGGVTTVFEMPNTTPTTTDPEALSSKRDRAASRSLCNFGLFFGATTDNAACYDEIRGVPGLKIFMGTSTGDLLVSEREDLEDVFAHWEGRICVHAENQKRLDARQSKFQDRTDAAVHSEIRDPQAAAEAVEQACELAIEHRRDLHILHLSTSNELDVLEAARERVEARNLDLVITAEVCPHHLFLDTEAYGRLGTRARVNPPLREPRHRRTVREALTDGRLQFVATDHAPHTPDEKDRSYRDAPSGLPGVQTMLPLLLDAALAGDWTPEKVVDWLAHVPADLYGIENRGVIEEGAYADLVLVDPDHSWTIAAENQHSKCGWTPWEGRQVQGRPVMTFVGGEPVYTLEGAGTGEILAEPGVGREVTFTDG